jgi:hypothetical protein
LVSACGRTTLENDTHKIASSAEDSPNGRITKRFPQLLHNFLRHTRAEGVLLRRVQRGETDLRAGMRNENLVIGHMPGTGMVLTMGDAPGMEWDTETE